MTYNNRAKYVNERFKWDNLRTCETVGAWCPDTAEYRIGKRALIIWFKTGDKCPDNCQPLVGFIKILPGFIL